MTWVLSVSVEAVEVESSALSKQQGATVKRGLALRTFQSTAESVWGAWDQAEKRVTEDLLMLLEPPPISLGVH